MGQRSGCFVASHCDDGGIAIEGIFCKNAFSTRALVTSKGRPTTWIDAWAMRLGIDYHKGFNAPGAQFMRYWNLNPFQRPENLVFEMAPYVLAILMARRRLREVETGKLITNPDELIASRALFLERASPTSPSSAAVARLATAR